MSTGYKITNAAGLYFTTMTVRHWIDIFTRRIYNDIIVDSLNFCIKTKGLEVYAWVIMTNHLHLIIRAKDNFLLTDILRDFKKFTSKEIINTIKNNPQESRKEWLLRGFTKTDNAPIANRREQYQFWQVGSHPVELWSAAVIDEKMNYLHQNPVKSGFVFRAEDYLYSSAADYAGEKGLIDICILQ